MKRKDIFNRMSLALCVLCICACSCKERIVYQTKWQTNMVTKHDSVYLHDSISQIDTLILWRDSMGIHKMPIRTKYVYRTQFVYKTLDTLNLQKDSISNETPNLEKSNYTEKWDKGGFVIIGLLVLVIMFVTYVKK